MVQQTVKPDGRFPQVSYLTNISSLSDKSSRAPTDNDFCITSLGLTTMNLSQARFLLVKLQEHVHELSNTVGMTMNYLILAATEDKDKLFDRLAAATEQAMRASGTLQMLMWDLKNLVTTLEAGDQISKQYS